MDVAATGRRGFTAFEMAIVLSIITIVTLSMLVRLPAFSSNIALQNGSRLLALSYRRAQNMAFSVRQVPNAAPTPEVKNPPGFGLSIAVAPAGGPQGEPFIFADFKTNGSHLGRYSTAGGAGADTVVEAVRLPPGVIVSDIIVDPGGLNQSVTELFVTYDVPEARAMIMNGTPSADGSGAGGGSAWGIADVVLKSVRTGQEKRIRIRETGFISVR